MSTPLTNAVHLFHRRYSVPVIALLHRHGGLRFSTFLAHLPGAARDTLSATLSELVANGLVVRQGDGYALTATGKRLGSACDDAVRVIPAAGLFEVALKKWPLLALAAIADGAGRFNEVKAALPGITSGALAPALKDLEAAGLIERNVEVGYPPTTSYRLLARSAEVLPAVQALVAAADTLADGLTAD